MNHIPPTIPRLAARGARLSRQAAEEGAALARLVTGARAEVIATHAQAAVHLAETAATLMRCLDFLADCQNEGDAIIARFERNIHVLGATASPGAAGIPEPLRALRREVEDFHSELRAFLGLARC